MDATPEFYIESEGFRAALTDRLPSILDGGARGGVFAPFDALAADLEVVGFEADPAAAGAGTISRALWNASGMVHLHAAAGRSASSVHPPNLELLASFAEESGLGARRTEEVIPVQAVSIDDAVAEGLCPAPDFIKLDVHSSEYEALEGAARALENVVGVLVETWHSPVHAGQRLHGDVERLLNGCGLFLFDLCPAAAWRHAVDGETSAADRARLMASESLFLRDADSLASASRRTALIAIAVADLYGYTGHAAQLARRFAGAGVLPAALCAEIETELLGLRSRRERELEARRGRPLRQLARRLLRRSPRQEPWSETGVQRLTRRPS